MQYNEAHGITPQQIRKEIRSGLSQNQENLLNPPSKEDLQSSRSYLPSIEGGDGGGSLIAADPIVEYMSRSQLEKSIARTRKLMQEAAKQLNFAEAAQYRDEMFRLEEMLKTKQT